MPAVGRVRRAGEHGLLIELADGHHPVEVAGWLREGECGAGLTEIVPGACTVLLLGPSPVLRRAAELVAAGGPGYAGTGEAPRTGATVRIPVRYDGVDLEWVAERSGFRPEEVARRHAGARHTVEMFGFAPGQAFFAGIPEPLRLPRRDDPRTRVPAGSVAIANAQTTIYPGGTPGGWHVIATLLGPPLWDPSADPPNRVRLGDRVVFEPRG